MVFSGVGRPLKLEELPIPTPKKGEILIKVHACGVCRTDLHIISGELPNVKIPLILGHQIVGESNGTRVGVPWLGYSCGLCPYCQEGKENLCDKALYTGYQINGGFAEYCVANEQYVFPLPSHYSDIEAAPLLCAGLIGYRSYRRAGPGKRIGFYGFGNAAQILIQIALFEGREVFAFTRQGDAAAATLAKEMGAVWVGSSDNIPPEPLDCAIIFAPVGSLIPQALKAVKKGGRVVSAGIHMSDIPSFPYSLLWEEREVTSVANLTRKDGEEFFKIASQVKLKTFVTPYPLERANEALQDQLQGKIRGCAVITLEDI